MDEYWLYPTPVYDFGKNRESTCGVSVGEDETILSVSIHKFFWANTVLSNMLTDLF